MTILKKINPNFERKKNLNVSFVIPCKNEERNIKHFEKNISTNNMNYEYLFGDDKSDDRTLEEIEKLSKKLNSHKIIKYNGPGICKSENVYAGIEKAKGDVVVIYDADNG